MSMDANRTPKNRQGDADCVVTEKFIRTVEGRCIPVRGDDIDTDRIIPARFLTSITFEVLGKLAFFDERFDQSPNRREHPFNDLRFCGASIMVVGRNFGCGSSREHAPQALMRNGTRAIVGESFAAIFADNCCSIGIPTLCLQKEDVCWMMDAAEKNPGATAKISIQNREIEFCNRTLPFQEDESHRRAFLDGRWDAVYELLEGQKDADRVAAGLPYVSLGRKPG